MTKLPHTAFKKGMTPWNKGMKGYITSASFKKGHADLVPPKSRKKAGEKNRGSAHPLWKGNSVGYFALHAWVARNFVKPDCCDKCSINVIELKIKRLEWASVGQKYSRNREDWMALCIPCHRKYDDHPFFHRRTDQERSIMKERVTGSKNPFYGKKHSKETIEKMRLSKMKNTNAKK